MIWDSLYIPNRRGGVFRRSLRICLAQQSTLQTAVGERSRVGDCINFHRSLRYYALCWLHTVGRSFKTIDPSTGAGKVEKSAVEFRKLRWSTAVFLTQSAVEIGKIIGACSIIDFVYVYYLVEIMLSGVFGHMEALSCVAFGL